MNGKCIFVAGGDFVEIEGGIESCSREWLGQKISREWHRGMQLLDSLDFLDMGAGNVNSQGSTA